MEKLLNFTDPACRTRDGVDRVFWVQFAASQVFGRRGGKAVDLHQRYQAATANSSNLAGFLEMDLVGATGGHPASLSAGDKLPVNFGVDKTCVFPTYGRAATELDIGKSFDVYVSNDNQYINVAASAQSVLTITEVLDTAGAWVAAKIADGKKYGAL